MDVNIKDLLQDCGMSEALYPGKRIVQKLPQQGENKSHCVVYDWRHPDLLRVEIKPGLHGKDLPHKELVKYPVSFQSPTYVEIATSHEEEQDTDEEGDEESESGSGSKSGSGKGPMKKKLALNAFSKVVEGKIPSLGEVKKLVVMGKEIAKQAFEPVLRSLAAQIKGMKITPVNILAAITSVTKIAPGGRKLDEINPTLLKGAKPYKPQDMFGVSKPT